MSAATLPSELALPWHANLWQQVRTSLKAGRMAHALLVCGPPGVGKRRFAERLARALLCHTPHDNADACGQCPACRQWAAGSHPDVSLLEPQEEGALIRVEPMRVFTRRLQLTPQYRQGRLGWIDPAEQLNIAAANSLLKTLEEPPAGTHLLLLSSHPHRLLPTIRSRCRLLRVPPAPVAMGREWLAAQRVDTSMVVEHELRMPLRVCLDSDTREREQRWAQDLARLLAGRSDAVLLAERWAEQPPDQLLDWLYRTSCAMLEYRLVGSGLHDRALARSTAAASMARLVRLSRQTARAAYLRHTNSNWQQVLEALLLSSLV